MEIAKNLAQWRGQTTGQWVARINRILPPIVIAVIVVLIARQAVDLMWALLDRPAEQDSVPTAVPADRGSDTAASTWSLADAYGLFGEAPAVNAAAAIPAADIYDVPPTDLNLTLVGLLVAQELPERDGTVIPEAGAAIIAVGRSQQKVYWTGDPIEGVPNASLYLVFNDRVLLDRGAGREREALFYKPDENNRQGSALSSRVSVRTTTPSAPPPVPAAAAAGAADRLTGIAATLGQVVNMQPQIENGELIGMRLQPRGDNPAYTQLGFEPGDVMLEVNGLRVTNLRNTQAISQALAETDQASVRIRRNGQDQTVFVNLADIERLAESLQ